MRPSRLIYVENELARGRDTLIGMNRQMAGHNLNPITGIVAHL